MTRRETRDGALPSWRDGATRDRLLAFLADVEQVPPHDRVAVFDNDGTLWCERPGYVQLDFMISVLRVAAKDDPGLLDRPEYAAVLGGDRAAMAELGLPRVALALAELGAGMTPEAFSQRVHEFVFGSQHPTLGVPYAQTVYTPMIELLHALDQLDFTVFIVTGGGTEFVRSVSLDLYGIPSERVIGTLIRYTFTRQDGRPVLVRTAELDGHANEGETKVSNLQRHIGRRPIFAAGNSSGDSEMLEYAAASPGPHLSLIVDHDDAEREFAYESKGETVASATPMPEIARTHGWTVASVHDDWSVVFADD